MTTSLLARPIEEYAETFTTPEPAPLAALNRDTNLKRGDAVMLSGHLQGATLQMLSHMIKPACVLEIGTFTGYSAICLAAGLQEGGRLHTIEIDEELEDMAAHYIEAAGCRGQVVQHIGVAAEIIPTLDEVFDLAFIDADKLNYELYYDLIFPKLAMGGFIIADNVLYDGEVVKPEEEQSKNARAIHSFNLKVKADDRIERLLLPVRDGLMIIRKIAR
jgi:predicted O-methyltransferase YrrM